MKTYVNGHGAMPTRRVARNDEIYHRHLLGEGADALAKEFQVHRSRIWAICQAEERRRRLRGEPWGERLLKALARSAYLEGLEPYE